MKLGERKGRMGKREKEEKREEEKEEEERDGLRYEKQVEKHTDPWNRDHGWNY